MLDTLFGHLALTFGKHPENLATEALAFTLHHSKAARDALRELLAQLRLGPPDELHWITQVGADDGSRPDLVGYVGDGQPIIIEAKFWAGLTENQPVTYLARPDTRALVFVAPAARALHLWGELRRRCESVGRNFVETGTSIADARVAEVGDERRLALLSWSTMLAALLVRVEAANDRRAADDLVQLRGLCSRMDSDAFLPISSEELTTHVYRRVAEFGDVVDDVVEKLVEDGLASTKGLRSTAGKGWYGRYLMLQGVGVMLMCDVRKWNKFAATPLWLSVYGANWQDGNPQPVRKALVSLEVRHPPQMFMAKDGFPTIPLFVHAGAERDDVIRHAVEQVVDVGRLIAHLGTVGMAAQPPQPKGSDA
jgi:hypothetical protein